MKRIGILLILLPLLFACTNHRIYYEADLSKAAEAERQGDLQMAYGNLLSAILRAKTHLKAKDVSVAYYDMGTFLSRVGQYKKSIDSLQKSVTLANESGAFDELEMGRRYIEIAKSYAGLEKWKEGQPFLDKVAPYREKYTGEEAALVDALFTEYSQAQEKQAIESGTAP